MRAAALLALVVAAAVPGRAAERATASISYLTTTSAYLDAGREHGLREGSIVTVVRDGGPVATLEVTAVSSRRASCTRPPGVELAVGDRVTFVPAATPTPVKVAPSLPAPAPPRRRADRRLGGRIGFRYLGFADRSALGGSYSQPGLDLRLQGTSLRDRFDVSVDLRARRTWRTLSDGSGRDDARTRVYALLGRWHASSEVAVTVGRQVTASLASVSLFDGVSAAREGVRWSVGAFGGTQPDVDNYGWSDRTREWGAWIGWRSDASGPGAGLTTGFVSSREDGALDREYFVLQGRLRRRTLFAQVTQEIDLNRGWKRESDPLVLPTSTLVTARWDVHERVALDGGFDSRRAVRLYRDRVTPETEFDDGTRRGAWGGVRWRPFARTSVGMSYRASGGGDAGAADAATATVRADWPRWHGASLGLRSTRYANERLHGWLHSATAGAALGSRVRADLTLGSRDESDPSLPGGGNDIRWTALDLDVRLARAWYALVSGERSAGTVENNARVHASAVWRF